MKKIKKSIITKKIEEFRIIRSIKKTYLPKSGDVAVFKVLSIGKHKAIQGENGNNTYIFPEDLILVAFGTRYATNQFEGYLPDKYYSKYQILGQGGVVGILKSMHAKFEDIGATEVKLVGYAVDKNNNVINTRYFKEEPKLFNPFRKRDYKTYLSVGASMDSGKTTTAAFLSRGFMKQKKKTAFIKLTGTVYAKDCSVVRDCGADIAIDFSYCGYPSTYLCETKELLNLLESLLIKIEKINPDSLVIEIADGLLQRETNALLKNKSFMQMIDHTILSCADSLSVASGINMLSELNHKPSLISGMFTASPLMVNEVKQITDIPVFTLEDFMDKKKFNNVFRRQEEEKIIQVNEI